MQLQYLRLARICTHPYRLQRSTDEICHLFHVSIHHIGYRNRDVGLTIHHLHTWLSNMHIRTIIISIDAYKYTHINVYCMYIRTYTSMYCKQCTPWAICTIYAHASPSHWPFTILNWSVQWRAGWLWVATTESYLYHTVLLHQWAEVGARLQHRGRTEWVRRERALRVYNKAPA